MLLWQLQPSPVTLETKFSYLTDAPTHSSTVAINYLVTHVAVAVTLARSTRFASVFRATEIARYALFAFLTHGQIGTGVTDGVCLGSLTNQSDPGRFNCFTPALRQDRKQLLGCGGQRQVVPVAHGRVSVAVFETRDALSVIAWVTNEKRPAPGALRTHRVVETVQTDVQLVRFRARTLRMTIAFALNAAIRAYITEMTTTHIRLQTVTMKAALR